MAKALWLATVLVLVAGCEQKVKCGFGAKPGTATWTSCSDGQARAVDCQRGESSFKCQCLAGAAGAVPKPVATFTLPSLSSLADRESATRTANEQCGWALE